ncbi:MAG: cytochrome c3 family protein, partial [Opitutus sp.]
MTAPDPRLSQAKRGWILCLGLVGLACTARAGDTPANATTRPAAAEIAEPAVLQPVVANSDCMDCHEAELTPGTNGQPGTWEGIRPDLFSRSVHGQLNCVDCHATITSMDHPSTLPPAQCASCHQDEVAHYATSIHGMSHQMGASEAASCASCHGTHDMVPVKQLDSPVFKLNLPKTCGTCHDDDKLAKNYRIGTREISGHYLDSIHGRAMTKMGLIVAPSCNDCHGVHDIKRSVDRDSRSHHANIATTCGKCHLGIEEIYNESVHGMLLTKDDQKGPVCTDCHTAHDIEKPATAHFKANSDASCGQCHQDRLTHYRETYHGKAMALGQPNVASDVAACFDCHGHHDVFPVHDERSRLHRDNIVETCQQCHAGVNEKFTQYQAHANPLDKVNYPILNKVFWFMTTLLVSVFSFFALHTLLWLVRSIYLFLHDSK